MVGGEDALILTVGRTPGMASVLDLDLTWVRGWRNRGPRPRTRNRQLTRHASIESAGIAFGMHPEAAYFLPPVQWIPLAGPRVLDGEGLTPAAALARLPRRDGPRRAAIAAADEVRACYGRCLADIAYRIENSALFDSADPTTRQFETALALWADVAPTTPDDEVVRRSAMVSVTFDAARANAETLGLSHLPHTARDQARRAAGAARIAARGATAEERTAAQQQLIRILKSLALYYLPDPDRLPAALPR